MLSWFHQWEPRHARAAPQDKRQYWSVGHGQRVGLVAVMHARIACLGAVRLTSPSISIHLTAMSTRSLKSATRWERRHGLVWMCYVLRVTFAYRCFLNLNSKNCVLSLGCRHSVGAQKRSLLTPQKVCVWCVFESHTHSVRLQKLSHWFYFEKWCPGAESNHRHEDFQ